ncbi:hypothetical protein HJC23_000993 [Cyclotella cryptica]|uniref:Uncharacterized protein n=1 Tax=Cyclotella cryptica TaxID=29204 RepID=A0ABD3NZQ6_9STRA
MHPRIAKALHHQWQYVHRAPLLAAGIASISVALLTKQPHDSPSTSIPSSFRLTPPVNHRQTLCEQPLPTSTASDEESEPERFQRILAYHRGRIAHYRSQWEYKMPSSTKDSSSTTSSTSTSTVTPSRSWPDDIPPDDDLPMLLQDIKYCARSPNFRSDKEYCHRLTFRVSCALLVLLNDDDQHRGLEMLRSLAEKGYRDAMTYYGMCLNEGRGWSLIRSRPCRGSDGVRICMIMRRVNMSWVWRIILVRGLWRMGRRLCSGFCWRRSRIILLRGELTFLSKGYMLGDCLLDGEGVEMDRGLALEWLIRSAELGHRGARSRVMAVLEKQEGQDYGRFTDASRQTLVEHTVLSANKKGQIIQRRTTRVRKIGGGARNPVEFKRRQTIVHNSREDS